MLQGARHWQASVPSSTATGPRPDTAAATVHSDQPSRDAAAAAREGGPGGAAAGTGAALTLVRASVVAPRVSCGICGGLLQDATAFTECLHAFCRKCIHDKVVKDNIKSCPKCGVFLGNPLQKLRPDHSLQHIRSLLFPPAKRRKIVTMKKRKERVSSELSVNSVLGIAAPESKTQKDLASVERDALSGIKGRDIDSTCGLTEETGALIVWQASPTLEEMVAHNQLDSKQDPEGFKLPATSDIENQRQRQGPTAQMTNISFMVESSFSARPAVQDDENLRGDFLTMINENNTRIMGRYDAHMSKLKAENTKLIEEFENERERTRILEEKLQRLEHEKEAAIERTKVLDNRLQKESEIAQTTASQNKDLQEKISELHEELEHGRADNQALMSDILEKSEELATFKYYSNMLESEKTYLENQLDHRNEELKHARAEHRRYVSKILDAARAIPSDLEPINSNALLGSRRPQAGHG